MHPFVIVATEAIPSEHYRNSSVSLEMAPAVWNDANKLATKGKLPIGWYHGHPGLGAFFSGTDRKTQATLFSIDHSVGLVVDPLRHWRAVFIGPDFARFSGQVRIIDADLGSATYAEDW
jgi:proteasome lid subunit RPN8/RPN11